MEVLKEEWKRQVTKSAFLSHSVASERIVHALVRRMPRFQRLTGIKLTGQ